MRLVPESVGLARLAPAPSQFMQQEAKKLQQLSTGTKLEKKMDPRISIKLSKGC
jgi:hypothetical protein